MKVGTDGVLLGAWAAGFPAARALDVGTGTGLIAIILANSGVRHVEAVELDESAFLQACVNVAENGLTTRVSLANTSFQAFTASLFAKASRLYESSGSVSVTSTFEGIPGFDLIVANPPYFSDSLKSLTPKRSLARHDDTLPVADLLDGVLVCLAPEGVFAVIVPHTRMQHFVTEAVARGLYLRNRVLIRTREEKGTSRVLMAFRKCGGPVEEHSLIIHLDDGSYSNDFKNLTRNIFPV